MSYRTVQWEQSGAVGRITLNRPESLNAWTAELGEELRRAITTEAADESVRAVLVTGAGRGFSSGADLKAGFDAHPDDGRPDVKKELHGLYHPIIVGIRHLEKPVVAAVNGPAVGIGCSLALACDLRLAGESAQFGIPAAKLGIVYTVQSTASLTAITGPANAARVLFTGAAFDAKTSYDMGIATAVYPDDRLAEETYRLARQIAQNAPFSVAGAKKIIQAYLHDPSFERTPEVHELAVRCFMTADHREGARAFLEKRRPVFRGR